ncbi:MAG: HAD-IA family hydrolase [Streptosporangiaceae bacterium]
MSYSLSAPAHWAGLDVLFLDFDGVITDSEYVHYEVWRDEFRSHGLLLSTDAWAEHWAANRAEPGDMTDKPPVTVLLERRLGVPLRDGGEVTRRVRARYRQATASLPVRPGVDGWLREAVARGVRCVVVTDNEADRVRDALARLSLASLIETVIGREPHRVRKPAADGYRTALRLLSVGPDQAVAVEDSPHGVAAARGARLRCLAVPHKITSHLLTPKSGVVIVEPAAVNLDRALALLARQTSVVKPVRVDESGVANRIWGSLAGLGLGDAIGKLIDKRPGYQLERESLALLVAFGADADPPAIFTGRITDDTVLALALATTVTTVGAVSRDALEKKLRIINPQGGRQIYQLKAAAGPLYVAADGATNGCVPRSAAIGYLYRPDELGDLSYDVLKTVTLTHAHPDAVMAALAFTVVTCCAAAGEKPGDALRVLSSALAGLERISGAGAEVGKAILQHAAAVQRFARPAKYVDYLEDTVGMAVAARSSAVAGICLGLSGLPPRQVLPILLRRRARWDLDSVAAIYGALAGAFAPEAIPGRWVERVERYTGHSFTRLAHDLHSVRIRRQTR